MKETEDNVFSVWLKVEHIRDVCHGVIFQNGDVILLPPMSSFWPKNSRTDRFNRIWTVKCTQCLLTPT